MSSLAQCWKKRKFTSSGQHSGQLGTAERWEWVQYQLLHEHWAKMNMKSSTRRTVIDHVNTEVKPSLDTELLSLLSSYHPVHNTETPHRL